VTDVAIDAPKGAYRERAIEPKRTALLSIDMQNAEYSPELIAAARKPGSPTAHMMHLYETIEKILIPNQQKLQAAARKAGIEVIYTTIESLTQDGRDRSLDHKISRLHFPKGSNGAKIIPAVGPVGDEIHIPKTSSGIFNSTNIEYVLRNLGIDYLVIYGIMTDQCVECAIRDAADRGFLVTQVEDACAAEDAKRHAISLDTMRGHYCRTRTTAQMITEIDGLQS
jgi:biuret amidohydrolase